jgi:hypothetical protein
MLTRIVVDRFKGAKGAAGSTGGGHKAGVMTLKGKVFRVRGRIRHSDVIVELEARKRNHFQLLRQLPKPSIPTSKEGDEWTNLGGVLGGVKIELALHRHGRQRGEGWLFAQRGVGHTVVVVLRKEIS